MSASPSCAAEVIAKGGFTNVSNQAMQIRLEALKLVVDGAKDASSEVWGERFRSLLTSPVLATVHRLENAWQTRMEPEVLLPTLTSDALEVLLEWAAVRPVAPMALRAGTLQGCVTRPADRAVLLHRLHHEAHGRGGLLVLAFAPGPTLRSLTKHGSRFQLVG